MITREQKIKRVFNGHWDDNVIDIEKWKDNKKLSNDKMCMQYKGIFTITDICDEGYFVLQNKNSQYRVLFPSFLKEYIKIGDQIKCTLYKKIFFVYWEIHKIKKLNLIK